MKTALSYWKALTVNSVVDSDKRSNMLEGENEYDVWLQYQLSLYKCIIL